MKNLLPVKKLSILIASGILASTAITTPACAQNLFSQSNLSNIAQPANANFIQDRYIVVLKSPEILKEILGVSGQSGNAELFKRVLSALPIHANQLVHGYQNAFFGFSAKLTPSQAKALQGHGMVQFVEQDQKITISQTTQNSATWGLDRIDSRPLSLDSTYRYTGNGQGVHAYVVDTGIRPDHAEFTNRLGTGFDATQAAPGTGSPGNVGADPVLGLLLGLLDTVLGSGPVDSPITIGQQARSANDKGFSPQSTDDCNGHGTHVAGTIGGTRYGVAKAVTLYPVKTIGCDGTGSLSALISGIEWVISNHKKPAVMNMSLGGGSSTAVDRAVRSAVEAGIVTVVAAGNENTNACNSSPAREPVAITVASSDRSDNRSSFSNFGTCVDVFAPGTQITSAGIRNPNDAVVLSGTSMASPHVAGHVAKMLQRGVDPDLVPSQLITEATPDVVKNVSSSPNRLLFSN